MLPPIKYSVHPKMNQILSEKRHRRQLLLQARRKEELQLSDLKKDKRQYMADNKQAISKKQKEIYEKRLTMHNKIKAEDEARAANIATKRAQKLIEKFPERQGLIMYLREEYLRAIQEEDQIRKTKVKKIMQERIFNKLQRQSIETKPGKLEEIKKKKIIDINQGICVLCLSNQSEIYMVKCKHMISCKQCEFMLRLEKKCPLCRIRSNFKHIH